MKSKLERDLKNGFGILNLSSLLKMKSIMEIKQLTKMEVGIKQRLKNEIKNMVMEFGKKQLTKIEIEIGWNLGET